MSSDRQPYLHDAILGGQSPPPLQGLVLGGLDGINHRLQQSSIEDAAHHVHVLCEALNHGQKGTDLIVHALQHSLQPLRVAASFLVHYGHNPATVTMLQECRIFAYDVISVDASGSEIKRLPNYNLCYTERLSSGVSLEMVTVPAGSFRMGSKRYWTEQPVHKVTVPPFCMSKYPVTQAQWQAVAALSKVQMRLKLNPCKEIKEDHPVRYITWEESIEFCARLSEKTGHTYRLASEAEWEYACQAVPIPMDSPTAIRELRHTETVPPFHFGEAITPDLANYSSDRDYGNRFLGRCHKQPTPVGSYPPNAFGLYDLHGNVREWCMDHWHKSYYVQPPRNGSPWFNNHDDGLRIVRGGSWKSSSFDCRSASRVGMGVRDRYDDIGFRIVRSLQ